MKKILTDTEKIETLTGAITRADRELNLILEPMDHRTSERLLTVCRRVRKILRAALEKVCGAQAARAPGQALDGRSSADVPSAEREAATQSGASTCTSAAGGSTKKGESHGKA